MIHEIGVELQAALKAKGCPHIVVDGPERRKTDTFGRERIVIEPDDTGDQYGPSHTNVDRGNPRIYAVRNIGIKLTIYAQEPKQKALEFEHRRRCEHVLDMIVVALNAIAVGRKNLWRPVSGKFITPDDFKSTEAVAGAVYEFHFWIDRGIADRQWSGAVAGEAIVGTDFEIDNSVEASPADDPADTITAVPSDAETASQT